MASKKEYGINKQNREFKKYKSIQVCSDLVICLAQCSQCTLVPGTNRHGIILEVGARRISVEPNQS